MKLTLAILALALPCVALAEATTATRIGDATYVQTPGQPTTRVTTIGDSIFISRPGEKTIRCSTIGDTTRCN